MGISQSEIEEFDDLKRNYGSLKYNQGELVKRIDKLDIDRAAIDQNFQKQQTDLKNAMDDLKKHMRELKHEYTIAQQSIDEEQTELRYKMQELHESICSIKISELQMHHRGSIHRRKHT